MDKIPTPAVADDIQKEMRALAHDIRNALAGISNYAELLILELEEKGMDTDLQAAREIRQGVLKINEILVERVDRGLK